MGDEHWQVYDWVYVFFVLPSLGIVVAGVDALRADPRLKSVGLTSTLAYLIWKVYRVYLGVGEWADNGIDIAAVIREVFEELGMTLVLFLGKVIWKSYSQETFCTLHPRYVPASVLYN